MKRRTLPYRLFRIWDSETKEYITTGNYTKKTVWKVFPSEAIKESKLKGDRYEVHSFILNPEKAEKYTLNKEIINK